MEAMVRILFSPQLLLQVAVAVAVKVELVFRVVLEAVRDTPQPHQAQELLIKALLVVMVAATFHLPLALVVAVVLVKWDKQELALRLVMVVMGSLRQLRVRQ
jgi:ABC-type phosphate transport system permease subunit